MIVSQGSNMGNLTRGMRLGWRKICYDDQNHFSVADHTIVGGFK